MARPRKSGLSYFPLDTNFTSDKDIQMIKNCYGWTGVMFFVRILEQTYGGDGYYLVVDDDWEFLIADFMGISRELVQQLVRYFVSRSLLAKRTVNGLTCKSSILTEAVTVITSPGIQRRYQFAVAERGRKNAVKVDGRIWLLDEEETLPFIKVSGREGFSRNNEGFSRNNEGFSRNNSTNKRKENKTKREKTYTPSAEDVWFDHPDVNAAFIRYLNIRAGGGNLMRPQVEALKEQLLAMSAEPAEQIKIIDQSTRAGWKMFYELGGQNAQRQPSRRSGVDGFRNIDQRSYDYAALERQLLGGAGS